MNCTLALRLILLFGVVSLLADTTYEGARSVYGPFLATLGASSLVVGIAAGGGELIGYGLRLVSGLLSDRTRAYWGITFIGYAVNMLAVPLLALAGRWEVAVVLMLAERAGKAIRTPARDVLLARVAQSTGRGWGFGVHEALDQIGAVLGPIVVAGVIATRQDYREGFALLAVPAALTLTVLVVLWRLFPKSESVQSASAVLPGGGLSRTLGAYLIAAAALGAGFADFPLIAFHLKSAQVAPAEVIPLLYALAMASDAGAALVLGRLFDQRGLRVLSVAALIGAAGIPLAFLGNLSAAVLGVMLWGVGLGAQESILRAAIGNMVAPERQGAAYGTFNAVYGIAWFGGSAAMGVLYGLNPLWLVLFGVGAQVLAAALFWRIQGNANLG